MVARNIKEILGIDDNEYIKRMDNLKQKLGNKTLTIDEVEKIDPELAAAYKKFLSKTNYDQKHGMEAFLSNGEWNEVLISNAKMTAIYAIDESKLDQGLLKMAQGKGLPIVLLK